MIGKAGLFLVVKAFKGFYYIYRNNETEGMDFDYFPLPSLELPSRRL
jgi:hypothetical protein